MTAPFWTRALAALQGLVALGLGGLIWVDPVRLFDLAGYSVQARLPIALLAAAGVAVGLTLVRAALGSSPARLATASAPLALFHGAVPALMGLNIGALDPAYHGLGILPTTIMVGWVALFAAPLAFVWFAARRAALGAI